MQKNKNTLKDAGIIRNKKAGVATLNKLDKAGLGDYKEFLSEINTGLNKKIKNLES